METQTKSKSNQKWVIILLAILIALLTVVLIVILGGNNAQNISDDPVPRIGYAAEATVMTDQNALQAAMDEAMQNAKDGNVGLRYKNNAYSDDGVHFECFIANSNSNKYDMFLTIFSDAELTNQIFISGLVPPGSGFENITLEQELDAGDHRVYVALTQVDTDGETGEQVIKNQVVHTMDFHVTQ